ncbi:MAG: hypothetical protein JXQ96_14170 [Cyclobacteriaceae bacterium]
MKTINYPVYRSKKAMATRDHKLFLLGLNKDSGKMTDLAKKFPEKVKELEIQFPLWLDINKK